MESVENKWTIHKRIVATLKGEKTDRPPFIDRLEMWYRSHASAGTLPEEFKGLSLTEVHRAVGIGQEKYMNAYSLKLHGVEVISRFEGEILYREVDPVLDYFPHVLDLVPTDRAGVTVTEFVAPVGRVTVHHQTLPEMIAAGMEPYLKQHLIKDEGDYRTVMYILERAEYVPRYERFREEEARLGDIGFLVPCVPRIPFQQVLLEYLGEVPLFNALYDSPNQLQKLLTLLDEQPTEILHRFAEWPILYVEFPDNLHAEMTNPKLFAEHCLPSYQGYTEILHGQGKKPAATLTVSSSLCSTFWQSRAWMCASLFPRPH